MAAALTPPLLVQSCQEVTDCLPEEPEPEQGQADQHSAAVGQESSQLPVRSQVDAADSQIVSGADESGLQLQGSGVRLHRLLAAVSVCQSRP